MKLKKLKNIIAEELIKLKYETPSKLDALTERPCGMTCSMNGVVCCTTACQFSDCYCCCLGDRLPGVCNSQIMDDGGKIAKQLGIEIVSGPGGIDFRDKNYKGGRSKQSLPKNDPSTTDPSQRPR